MQVGGSAGGFCSGGGSLGISSSDTEVSGEGGWQVGVCRKFEVSFSTGWGLGGKCREGRRGEWWCKWWEVLKFVRDRVQAVDKE